MLKPASFWLFKDPFDNSTITFDQEGMFRYLFDDQGHLSGMDLDSSDYAVKWDEKNNGRCPALAILFSVGNAKSQDTLVSAFFGLDNALPGMLCNQPGSLLDGMPVNFQFPLDASSLSETDFEVLDGLGNVHTPVCALLAPANENGENRTVLLLGEFGTAVSNPPVEVSVVGELFTTETFSGESACSDIINLNGMTTTNVIPLADGPSLFFAQKLRVI